MSRMYIDSRYDAIVVGARVAGSGVAMLLSRAGQRVLVLERSAEGSDTTSTHALMRPGVMQLHRWGVLDRVIEAGTPSIRRTTFHYGDERTVVDIKERDGVGALYAPRRTVLDRVLAAAAAESGARVIYGATVHSVLQIEGRANGVAFSDRDGVVHRVHAPIVIGADGARSTVARAVGAAMVHETPHRCAVIYGYFDLELDGTHWHYGHDVAAGAIPTNDGMACVFAAMRPERYDSELRHGPERLFMRVLAETHAGLGERVAVARRDGKLHPFAGRAGFIRRAHGAGWALVGDAGCFKDPLTAHGITDALRDADALARAVLDGSDAAMAAYERDRDAFAVEFLHLSDLVGSFDWDLERVKQLHHQLSTLINREYEHVMRAGGRATIAA